ncbi:endolytic transglycosylase MltG [Patescibacteria group bacterium]
MNKKIIKICFLFFTTCFLFLVFGWWGIYMPKECEVAQEKTFVVEKGEGGREIALKLEKQGFIWWGPLFRIYTLTQGVSGSLKAGTYQISPSMSTPEIVDKLVAGDVVKDKITIIEGWNLRDIGWYFENRGTFQAEELFELVGFPLVSYVELPPLKDFALGYDFLADKPKDLNLEGYLFPDTYEITEGESFEEIVVKMLDNFDKKMTLDLKSEIKAQGKTIFEVMTMASLIEKEVRTQEDKKVVSGILWKRLRVNMPLQVDATISYITGRKTTKISIQDTKIDSFYNTYKYRGLPLGPICNPGIASIKAALYPEDSEYWYYLSTPKGETVFSRNLEEHNIAKAKYIK